MDPATTELQAQVLGWGAILWSLLPLVFAVVLLLTVMPEVVLMFLVVSVVYVVFNSEPTTRRVEIEGELCIQKEIFFRSFDKRLILSVDCT